MAELASRTKVEGLQRQFGAAQHDVGHLAHLQFEVGDFEQGDGLGGLLHLVDSVVQLADQVLDVAAIERRDEAAAHADQHLSHHRVGLVLMGHDAGTGLGRAAAAFQQVAQGDGAVLGEGVTVGADNTIAHGARIFPGVTLPDGAIKF